VSKAFTQQMSNSVPIPPKKTCYIGSYSEGLIALDRHGHLEHRGVHSQTDVRLRRLTAGLYTMMNVYSVRQKNNFSML